MSYISNNTRVSSLTIAGVDYTSSFVSWEASDSSANKNGCIETVGSVEIGTRSGGASLDDYDRNKFRRGDEVLLYVTSPGGSPVLHPRGRLYVISNVYDVESETITIEIGCRLTLLSITEDADDNRLDELRALVPVALDTAQAAYSNCCGAIASLGQYVFQNNSGAFQTGEFWAGDSTAGTAAGEWASTLGVTTNAVSPLTGAGAIPDQIRLSYQVPVDEVATGRRGEIDVSETESYYFLQYPVVSYQRQNTDATPENPDGTLDNIGNTSTIPAPTPSSSSCGNTPPPPDPGPDPAAPKPPSCNEGYTMVQTPVFLPAKRRDRRTTYYDGPGGQVSRILAEQWAPKIEVNQQYFADTYAFCRQTWSPACTPDGNCPYVGMDEIQIGYSAQENYYGSANELVRTTTDTYVTLLSAAKPSDWRAGNVAGEIQNFDASLGNRTDWYRVSRTEQIYKQEKSTNVQNTNVWTSITSRGVGISGGQELDAVRGGIYTKQVRKSATIVTLDVQPDILNTSTTSTEEKKELIPLFSGRFSSSPSEAGPYIIEEQVPQPLLFDDQSEIDSAVSKYSNYLSRFIKGDAFGLQIAEGLRSEVLTGWRPGMPFRYYDPKKEIVMAMRMDATAWGVGQQESVFVTNGMWNGISNGTVTPPSNVVGNSSPDMSAEISGVNPGTGGGSGSGTPGPAPPTTGGSIDGETSVDSGSYAFYVDVFFTFEAIANTFSADGVRPPQPKEPWILSPKWTSTCWVEGLIVESGDLLAANADGSIPIDYQGSLVTVDGVVVDADLFAST